MKQNQPLQPDMCRRWTWLGALAAVLPQWACSQQEAPGMRPSGPPLSPQDAALRHKFRGVYGGELTVDATESIDTAAIYMDDGRLFNIGVGSFGPGRTKFSGYGGSVEGDRLAIPKTLRLMIYPKDSKGIFRDRPFAAREGPPLVDVTVPVASRIPDEALDRIRKYNGSLSLRLRITPQTLLVGWEIRLGKSYPFKKDKAGNAVVTNEDMMVGGDFWPAQPINELQSNGYQVQVHKKGWQIDPKTGKKIETDF